MVGRADVEGVDVVGVGREVVARPGRAAVGRLVDDGDALSVRADVDDVGVHRVDGGRVDRRAGMVSSWVAGPGRAAVGALGGGRIPGRAVVLVAGT